MSLCRVSRRHFYTSVALAYAGSDTCSKSQINSNHRDHSIHIERGQTCTGLGMACTRSFYAGSTSTESKQASILNEGLKIFFLSAMKCSKHIINQVAFFKSSLLLKIDLQNTQTLQIN